MKRAGRGQSMVELAMVLPFCLWVLLGIIDFGRVYYFYTAATNAAREGARYWAAHYDPSTCNATTCATTVKARVQAEANSTISPGIDASLVTLSIPASGQVRVQVQYVFAPLTPFISNIWGGGSMTITTLAVMPTLTNAT